MTIDEYKKQMKGVCDYMRKLEGRIQALENEINELKKKEKPIVTLTDEQKADITKILTTDKYNNVEACGKVLWKYNQCFIEYCESADTPSDKQIEFGRKMISAYSNTEGINRFLFGKILDLCKTYKLNRVQIQTKKAA